jgi:hypothetical protein
VAKEAKTVRAAALSVGIFMMTGAAGAVPAFANVTPFLRLGDTLLSGPSAPNHSEALGSRSHVPSTGSPNVAKVCHGVLAEMKTAGKSFCAAAGLLRVLQLSLALTSALAGDSRHGEIASTDTISDEAQCRAGFSSDAGKWIVASTGIGTLPFIRPRRLGPVPFE